MNHDATRHAGSHPAQELAAQEERDPRLVLIVDDDPDFLYQHGEHFKTLGFDVITANCETAAEEMLQTRKPDLAVVDLMMEQSDGGFALCHEIKQRYPQTPIIMVTSASSLTGYDLESLSGEQRAWIQADAVLAKPIRFAQLKRQVDRLMDR